MEDVFGVLTLVSIAVLFFHFGYRDDFNRGPKRFKKTVVGVLIGSIGSVFGFIGASKWAQEWMKDAPEMPDSNHDTPK
jgi:hypothetical protein